MPKGDGARKSRMLGKAIETDIANMENQNAVNTENGKNVNTELSKSVGTDSGNTVIVPTEDEPAVSLTIKVPLSYRQHWQIEAKKRRTSVTSLVVEALSKELGLPES